LKFNRKYQRPVSADGNFMCQNTKTIKNTEASYVTSLELNA